MASILRGGWVGGLLGIVLLAASASGCTSGHAEGDQCAFGNGGFISTGSHTEDCEPGLYCHWQTQVCTRPLARGKACNPACSATSPSCNEVCASGLICDLSKTCQPPGPDGTLCTSNAHCATGLSCNLGYLPGDLTHGECHPPSGVGQPCSYTQYKEGANTTETYGCAVGLVCVPPTQTRASIVADPDGYCGDNSVCGFAGVCAQPYTVSSGEACLGPGSCANGGICYVELAPKSANGGPAFACNDGTTNVDCWHGPWPGLCGPGPARAPTYGNDCTATTCAPGFLCSWTGVCQPRWYAPSLVRCDTWGTGAANDDFCELGLHCAGDPPKCSP